MSSRLTASQQLAVEHITRRMQQGSPGAGQPAPAGRARGTMDRRVFLKLGGVGGQAHGGKPRVGVRLGIGAPGRGNVADGQQTQPGLVDCWHVIG